jgi:hypothetical protein
MAIITINIPSAHVTRLQAALEHEDTLPPGSATIATVKAHIVQELKNVIRIAETQMAIDNLVIEPIDPT